MRTAEEFRKLAAVELNRSTERGGPVPGIAGYRHRLQTALEQYGNLKLARERAAYYKWKVIESLDKYLIEFEANVIRKGGKVIWAMDAEAAREEILGLIRKASPTLVVRSHSSMLEEIDLPGLLRKEEINSFAGHIGDAITEKADSISYHVNRPALNRTVREVAELVNEQEGASIDGTAEDIVNDIRENRRTKFMQAELAITGANFLIADSGMVALCENEGNINMSAAFSKTQIVVAGIDKLVPGMNDLDIYLPLLSTYSNTRHLSVYNTITGPRQPGETEGPSEFVVVLVDNGRSNVLAQADQRQALSCIHCGACSYVCPVFTNAGGYAFTNGPIGAVTIPHQLGLDEYKHLSYASTLCGNCTDICPVNIDLHNHLLRNRRDAVASGHHRNADKMMWFSWKKMMLSRKHLNRASSMKNFILKSFLKNAWGDQREFPKVVDKSFNQLWRERNGG